MCVGNEMDTSTETRKHRFVLLSLREPWRINSLLLALAFAWIIVSFVFVSNDMYRWSSLAVATSLSAAAFVLFIRKYPFTSFRKYHSAMVDTLMKSEAVPLAVLNREGIVMEMNEACSRMLGYQRTNLIGSPIMQLIDPSCRHLLEEAIDQSNNGDTMQSNITIAHRSGFPLDLQIVCAPMNQDDEVIGTLMICHDLSDRKRNVERIRYMAYYDDMTGLPNRTLFQMKLTESLSRAKEDEELIGICYLDLDRFKLVNASFGREFGDMLLMQVAERLNRGLSDQDYVARMEGDEFALLLNSIETQEELLEKSKQILKCIEEPYELKGFPLHITASIGLVTNLNIQDDGYTLFKKADMALVKAKESGKNECLLDRKSVV